MLGRSLIAASLLLSAGCAAHDKAATEQQARAVADDFMRKSLPGANLADLPVGVVDMKDRWRFQYNEGGIGGVTVVVNKHSGEVVHSEAQQ